MKRPIEPTQPYFTYSEPSKMIDGHRQTLRVKECYVSGYGSGGEYNTSYDVTLERSFFDRIAAEVAKLPADSTWSVNVDDGIVDLYWWVKVENKNYDRELAKYESAAAKYADEMAEYKAKKAKYDLAWKAWEAYNKVLQAASRDAENAAEAAADAILKGK